MELISILKLVQQLNAKKSEYNVIQKQINNTYA